MPLPRSMGPSWAPTTSSALCSTESCRWHGAPRQFIYSAAGLNEAFRQPGKGPRETKGDLVDAGRVFKLGLRLKRVGRALPEGAATNAIVSVFAPVKARFCLCEHVCAFLEGVHGALAHNILGAVAESAGNKNL
eukprot:356923-Chlamydomonas_euryale.AAC.1